MSQQRPAKGGSGLDVRAAAARSLVPVLTDKGSLASLDEHSVVARDRGLLKELCYGTCRRLPLVLLPRSGSGVLALSDA